MRHGFRFPRVYQHSECQEALQRVLNARLPCVRTMSRWNSGLWATGILREGDWSNGISWDHLHEWMRPGMQWTGLTTGRGQCLDSQQSLHQPWHLASGRGGHCKCLGSTYHFPFSLSTRGKDAETFTSALERKYLSVQIITLQLIMQNKQYTRDLNIVTAWKFTVFEFTTQQVLSRACRKVAQA